MKLRLTKLVAVSIKKSKNDEARNEANFITGVSGLGMPHPERQEMPPRNGTPNGQRCFVGDEPTHASFARSR